MPALFCCMLVWVVAGRNEVEFANGIADRYSSLGVRQRPVSKDLQNLGKGVDWTAVTRTSKERELIQKVLKARRRSRRGAAIFIGMASVGFLLATTGTLAVLHSLTNGDLKERAAGLSFAVPGYSLWLGSLAPLVVQVVQGTHHDIAVEELNKAIQQRLEKKRFSDAAEKLAKRRIGAENGRVVSVPFPDASTSCT